MREEVVAIVYQPPRVLLGMKKRRFGLGKFNGFGGGIKDGESIRDAVIRETLEEACITLLDPTKMGRILFKFDSDEQDHLVHFFRAENYLGTPKETEEMIPYWFSNSSIPYDQMWDDDKYWLPFLLRGKKFIGDFHFDSRHKIKDYKLKVVEDLEE